MLETNESNKIKADYEEKNALLELGKIRYQQYLQENIVKRVSETANQLEPHFNNFKIKWNELNITHAINSLEGNFEYYYRKKQLKGFLSVLSKNTEALIGLISENKHLQYLTDVLTTIVFDLTQLQNLYDEQTDYDVLNKKLLAFWKSASEELQVCTISHDYSESVSYSQKWHQLRILPLMEKIAENFTDFQSNEMLLVHLDLLCAKITKFINDIKIFNPSPSSFITNLFSSLTHYIKKIQDLENNLIVQTPEVSSEKFKKIKKALVALTPNTSLESNHSELSIHSVISIKDLFTELLKKLLKKDIRNLFMTSNVFYEQLMNLASEVDKKGESTSIAKKLNKIRNNPESLANTLIKTIKQKFDLLRESHAAATKETMKNIKPLQRQLTEEYDFMRQMLSNYHEEIVKHERQFTKNPKDQIFLKLNDLINAIQTQPKINLYKTKWGGVSQNWSLLLAVAILLSIMVVGFSFLTRHLSRLPDSKKFINRIEFLSLVLVDMVLAGAIVLLAGYGIVASTSSSEQSYLDYPAKYLLEEHQALFNEINNLLTTKFELSSFSSIKALLEKLSTAINEYKTEALVYQVGDLITEIINIQSAVITITNFEFVEKQTEAVSKKYSTIHNSIKMWKEKSSQESKQVSKEVREEVILTMPEEANETTSLLGGGPRT